MASGKIGGLRVLTGRPEDYRDPIAAVTRGINQLIHDYAAAGGDLGAIRISVTAAPDEDVRGTTIRLEGQRA